jgi:hypothetical protein
LHVRDPGMSEVDDEQPSPPRRSDDCFRGAYRPLRTGCRLHQRLLAHNYEYRACLPMPLSGRRVSLRIRSFSLRCVEPAPSPRSAGSLFWFCGIRQPPCSGDMSEHWFTGGTVSRNWLQKTGCPDKAMNCSVWLRKPMTAMGHKPVVGRAQLWDSRGDGARVPKFNV